MVTCNERTTPAVKLLPVVKLLLQHTKDFDVQTHSTGQTALTFACFRDHTAIVEALLQAGASTHLQDTSGMTALMMASATGHASCVKALLKHGAEIDMRCDVKEAQLNNGNIVSSDLLHGCTALIVAAHYGQFEVVKILLQAGAAQEIAFSYDKDNTSLATALRTAEVRGHTKIAELLRKHDKNTQVVDAEAAKKADDMAASLIAEEEAQVSAVKSKKASKAAKAAAKAAKALEARKANDERESLDPPPTAASSSREHAEAPEAECANAQKEEECTPSAPATPESKRVPNSPCTVMVDDMAATPSSVEADSPPSLPRALSFAELDCGTFAFAARQEIGRGCAAARALTASAP